MTKIGFTGTRQGLTPLQLFRLRLTLLHLFAVRGARVLVHGGCVGADAEAHEIALALGYQVEIYPATTATRRAPCLGATVVHPPQPPLVRNHRIVDGVELLVACPAGAREVRRSGTWATIRYSRKSRVPVSLIPPA